jgi:hypothetical protein
MWTPTHFLIDLMEKDDNAAARKPSAISSLSLHTLYGHSVVLVGEQFNYIFFWRPLSFMWQRKSAKKPNAIRAIISFFHYSKLDEMNSNDPNPECINVMYIRQKGEAQVIASNRSPKIRLGE